MASLIRIPVVEKADCGQCQVSNIRFNFFALRQICVLTLSSILKWDCGASQIYSNIAFRALQNLGLKKQNKKRDF